MALMHFFSQLGKKLADKIATTNIEFEQFLKNRNETDFRFSRIFEIDILKICKALKPKSSTGSDCIFSKLLKEIAPSDKFVLGDRICPKTI